MSAWLVDLLVLLGILAIVCIAGWFIFSQINLPEPLRKILFIVLVVLAAIIAIALLLQMRGGIKLGGLRSESQFPAIGGQMPPPADITTGTR